MKVLISIKPEFAYRIFDRTKRFEFRKALYGNLRLRTLVVYVTRPVGLIIGEFDVGRIVAGPPAEVWAETETFAGINREFFDSYFVGREKAFALEVAAIRRFEPPIVPEDRIANFTPPQGYMYVDDDLRRSWTEDRQYDLFGA